MTEEKFEKLPFDYEELIALLEASRLALSDAEAFDHIAESLDLSDQYLLDLRDKLEAYLNPMDR